MAERPQRRKSSKVPRACDVCRRRKIKCDANLPECSNCAIRDVQCSFTFVKKLRASPQSRRSRNSRLVEERIVRMEDLIRNLGLSFGKNQNQPQLPLASTLQENIGVSVNTNRLADATSPGSEPQRTFSSDNDLQARYFGLRPTSLIDEASYLSRTQTSLMITDTSSRNDWPMWNVQIPRPRFCENSYLRLPPLGETLSLLQMYFDHFNYIFPLFDQKSFTSRVLQRHIQDPGADLVWWGALNVVLSLAFRLQAVFTGINNSNDRHAWGYLQNALSVVPDLTSCNAGFLGIQTLLGIAIVIQGTYNPPPASILIATAIKMLHQLGLHRKVADSNKYDIPPYQRDRTLWIAYILDKDYSLQLDQPPLMRDEDVDVDVPSDRPVDGLGLIFDSANYEKINLFRLRVHLAIIEDKIYTRLYSLQASKWSNQSRCGAVRELCQMLERWKNGVPQAFRPESMPTYLPKSSVPHLVILHLSHFHCLTMIYGIHFQSKDWASSALQMEFQEHSNNHIWRALEDCRPAARECARLMRLLPQGDFACIWVLFDSFIASLAIILTGILRNPRETVARSDMELVGPLLRLVDLLADIQNATKMGRVRAMCATFERRAKVALEQASV